MLHKVFKCNGSEEATNKYTWNWNKFIQDSHLNPLELLDNLRKIRPLVWLVCPAFLHHDDQLSGALQRNHVCLRTLVVDGYVLYDSHEVLQVWVRGPSAQNFPQQNSIRIYVHFQRILFSFEKLGSHPMLNNIDITMVPSCVVIISASGERDSPKSATFILNSPFYFATNTFKDLRSRWIITGFIECRHFIPSAISIAKLSLCFQLRTIYSFSLWSKSNKLPYIMAEITAEQN